MSELLKVLDMTAGEQQKWWEARTNVNYGCENCLKEAAFRLRDEARKENLGLWNMGILFVASYINESPMPKDREPPLAAAWQWAQYIILNQDDYPLWIVWIIAALIAKEHKK